MKKRILAMLLSVCLCVGLLSVGASASTAVAAIGTDTYNTLKDAIDAIKNYSGDGHIDLLTTCAETLTINGAAYLDLNGHDLTGTINTDNGKLYVMDSATDDWTEEGCGKITGTVSDPANVYGLTPNEISGINNSYLKVTEGSAMSFHAVNLQLDTVNLRPSEVGMYYSCDFRGDEAVARALQDNDSYGYGVAFSVNEAPIADENGNFKEKTASFFEGSAWGNSANTTGTILQNIMEPGNPHNINQRNAKMPVYGRAYIRTAEGVLYGKPYSCTLQEFVSAADSEYAKLEDGKQTALRQMYNTYELQMKSWSIPNLKEALQKEYENRPLKVLIIGHSLGIDAMYLLPEVIKSENPNAEFTLGMLYHSGCQLDEHVNYLTNNAAEYAYYEYDTNQGDIRWRMADANGVLNSVDVSVNSKICQTMEFGIQRQDWDIVVLQAGVFEAADRLDRMNTANIRTIRDYVLEKDIDPETRPEFGWNMTWAFPNDEALLNADYKGWIKTFAGDTTAEKSMDMYKQISTTLKNLVMPVFRSLNFKYLIPSGTAMENAKSSYLPASDLYRDTIHAKDFTRLMTSYVWYITLTGKDIDEVSFNPLIHGHMRRDTDAAGQYIAKDLVLTNALQAILRESVTNALNNPYEVTQSQYTKAP